jgi:hypothetical protein
MAVAECKNGLRLESNWADTKLPVVYDSYRCGPALDISATKVSNMDLSA